MAKYSDISIVCSQCGKKFVFSEDEQEFYKSKGYSAPLRCKQCRSARQPAGRVCSGCGNKLVEDSPLYCAACNINVHLEFEQQTLALKNLLHETELKLRAAEAEKGRIREDAALALKYLEVEKNKLLEEAREQIAATDARSAGMEDLLRQKELALAQKDPALSGLEQRLDTVANKLDKLPDSIVSMESSGHLMRSLKDKIEVLEKNQNILRELLLQLIDSRDNSHRDSSLIEALKSFFRSDRRSTA